MFSTLSRPTASIPRTGSFNSTSSAKSTGTRRRIAVFPRRLYDMLEKAEEEGYDHLVSWMPDGKSFKIHALHNENDDDEEEFLALVKKVFSQTKLKSFLRQLQLYGFEHNYKKGCDCRGECKHVLFVRGQRAILEQRTIEDFKQNSNMKRRSATKKEVISEPQETIPFTPVCTDEACSYAATSAIPTRLTNLVLSNNCESTVVSDYEDDVEPLPFSNNLDISYDDDDAWRQLELKLLGAAF